MFRQLVSIELVHELVMANGTHTYFGDVRVAVTGVRLKTFATKGVTCICCGRVGVFYRIDYNGGNPHLNLYAYNSLGKEVLMTRDHIICDSHGGANSVDNMNTMCARCNHLRGTRDLEEFLQAWKNGDYVQGGKIDKDKADLHNKKRELNSLGENLADEVKRLIDEHVSIYGFESHMKRIWVKGARRLYVREEIRDECEKLGDSVGLRIMQIYFSAGVKLKSAVPKYAISKHSGMGTVADYRDATQGDNIKRALGILMSLSLRQVDKPSPENEKRLRDHLKKCKGFRDGRG